MNTLIANVGFFLGELLLRRSSVMKAGSAGLGGNEAVMLPASDFRSLCLARRPAILNQRQRPVSTSGGLTGSAVEYLICSIRKNMIIKSKNWRNQHQRWHRIGTITERPTFRRCRRAVNQLVMRILAAARGRKMLALAFDFEAGAAVAFFHHVVDARRLNLLAGLCCSAMSRSFGDLPPVRQALFRPS
ncbi:hypothetical protein [Caballeronia glathei]|uniref:hypothetical protein n=1 Tax=Caballeronia glathei TaxID=60547 RepID=UPI00147073B2|nr:hypothetical protein [Caballeronia glathei]